MSFTILGGLLNFLIFKIPNIVHGSIILGDPLIFLIFVPKPNGTTKLDWKEYFSFVEKNLFTLSMQMPRGVPVATVAINNATNAGLLAVRMLGVADSDLKSRFLQLFHS